MGPNETFKETPHTRAQTTRSCSEPMLGAVANHETDLEPNVNREVGEILAT